MRLLERYSSAVNSGNLSVNPATVMSDTDVLGAVGLAGRYEPLGVALTRLFADSKVEPVLTILTEMVFKRARTVKVKLSLLQSNDLAKAVLGWHRHGRCQPCGGTGFQVIPDTPVQGDECPRCKGGGRVPFDPQFSSDTLELARWLSGQIDRSQAVAGSAAIKMLAPTLDL